jgi:hypothetical protein
MSASGCGGCAWSEMLLDKTRAEAQIALVKKALVFTAILLTLVV